MDKKKLNRINSYMLKNALLLAVGFICFKANASDTLIWRSIPISSGKALTLGANVANLNDVTIKDTKHTYHLKKGTFAGADSIAICDDKKSCIKSLRFFYALTYSFEQHLEVMQKSLNEPKSLKIKNNIKIAIWQDPYSRFTLIYENKNEKIIFYSILEDL